MIPNKLQKGDTVGVISPSSPLLESKLEDINKSKTLMENYGFKVKFAKNAFSNTLGYSATVKEKVDDIHEMFLDKEVKAIFSSTGGNNSSSLFEYLDYEIIKNNPKIICGFSDFTSLTNIIYQKTGLVTFNGATFKSLTSWETDYGYKEVIKRFCKDDLSLGQDDDEYITIKEGLAEGKLIGGNLNLFSSLVSGKYKVDCKDKILFIEDTGFEAEPADLSRYLYHMKQNGVFDEISGLWIGNYEHESGIRMERVVMDVLGDEYNFPIIKSNNFGHTDRKTVIPIGIMARINTKDKCKIKLLEKCVI